MAPASSMAVAAACSLEYLLQPMHWTGTMCHPRAPPSRTYWLGTAAVEVIILCFMCSEAVVMWRTGVAEIDQFTLVLSSLNSLTIWFVRLIHLAVRHSDFHKLALQVVVDFGEFLEARDVPVLRAWSRAVRRFLLVFVFFGAAASTMWNVTPISSTGLQFELALPYDTSPPLAFTLTWLVCALLTWHAAIMTVVADSFNVSLIAQLRMQLNLLSRNLVELVSSVGQEKSSQYKELGHKTHQQSFSSDYSHVHYLLRKIVLHHQAVIRNADLLESCLSGILLGQSLSIGLVVCLQLFQIATSDHGLQQAGKLSCYLMSITSQLFLYCWFGDDLITESDSVVLAAYEAVTTLQGSPTVITKSLLIFITRAQRPLRITAAGIFAFCRESLVSVLNVSYSFFTILRNFKE